MRPILMAIPFLAFLMAPRIAAACSPCDDALSLVATARRADLVVVAVRVADDTPLDGGPKYVTYAPFEVRRSLKGTPTSTRILVATENGMCYYGIEVERLAPSVLFLEQHGGKYTVVRDGCAVRSLPIVNDRVVLSDISLPVDTFGIELGLSEPAPSAKETPIRLGILLLCSVAIIGFALGVWLGRRAR
jgi:hypothetical protein